MFFFQSNKFNFDKNVKFVIVQDKMNIFFSFTKYFKQSFLFFNLSVNIDYFEIVKYQFWNLQAERKTFETGLKKNLKPWMMCSSTTLTVTHCFFLLFKKSLAQINYE